MEEKTYQICPGYMLRPFMEECLVIPVGPPKETGQNMAILSPVGQFLWQLLEKERTMEQLVEAVTGEYDTDPETAGRDIAEFLDQLRENHYLLKDGGTV